MSNHAITERSERVVYLEAHLLELRRVLAECVPYLRKARAHSGEMWRNTMSGDDEWYPDEAERGRIDTLLNRISNQISGTGGAAGPGGDNPVPPEPLGKRTPEP
jgi:hypothetical protein